MISSLRSRAFSPNAASQRQRVECRGAWPGGKTIPCTDLRKLRSVKRKRPIACCITRTLYVLRGNSAMGNTLAHLPHFSHRAKGIDNDRLRGRLCVPAAITPPRLTLLPVYTKLAFAWHLSQCPSNETFFPLQALPHKVSYVPGNGIGINASFRCLLWGCRFS